MAKTKISEFDSTPANNTDIDSINIAEGCAPSGVNNAIRELMSQLKDQQTGASGDNFTVGGNLVVTGTSTFTGATTFTGAVVMSTVLPISSGGTGASTAANARTNLSAASRGANSDITSITGLTTALTVPQGGTGAVTHTSKGILVGNGTSAITTVSPSTSGNVLISNGTDWTSSTPGYAGANAQLFTSSGTFTIPTGVTALKVTLKGGGGGGGGGYAPCTASGGNGSAGGTTTFSTISQTGGGGGNGANNTGGGSALGTNSGVLYVISSLSSAGYVAYGGGGAAGTAGSPCGVPGIAGATNYPAIGYLTALTPGGTISVTIGAGGAGGSAGGGGGGAGGAGIAGVVLVEW